MSQYKIEVYNNTHESGLETQYKIEVYDNTHKSGLECHEFEAQNNEQALKELRSHLSPLDNEHSKKYTLLLFKCKNDSFIGEVHSDYYT